MRSLWNSTERQWQFQLSKINENFRSSFHSSLPEPVYRSLRPAGSQNSKRCLMEVSSCFPLTTSPWSFYSLYFSLLFPRLATTHLVYNFDNSSKSIIIFILCFEKKMLHQHHYCSWEHQTHIYQCSWSTIDHREWRKGRNDIGILQHVCYHLWEALPTKITNPKSICSYIHPEAFSRWMLYIMTKFDQDIDNAVWHYIICSTVAKFRQDHLTALVLTRCVPDSKARRSCRRTIKNYSW